MSPLLPRQAEIRLAEALGVPNLGDWLSARECYFALPGAMESDIGPRPESSWYWRRAARGWQEVAGSVARKAGLGLDGQVIEVPRAARPPGLDDEA